MYCKAIYLYNMSKTAKIRTFTVSLFATVYKAIKLYTLFAAIKMNTPNRVSINAHIEAKNIIFPRLLSPYR